MRGKGWGLGGGGLSSVLTQSAVFVFVLSTFGARF